MVAKATSKLRQDYKGSLTLNAPSDLRLKDFSKNGLIVPDTLDASDSAVVPLDFTSITNREIGQQLSAWSVRHSFLLYLLGNVRAEIGNTKSELKNTERRVRNSLGRKYTTKWELDDAVGRSKVVRTLRKELTGAEATLTRFEALAASYDVLRNACSREIARRQDERTSGH